MRHLTDRRSLTERQRKFLEMYADDVEGRTPTEQTTEAGSSRASGPQQTAETANEEQPLGG